MSNKAFLISIKPRFAKMIFSGEKTVELRRVPPKVTKGDLGLVYVSSPAMELQGCFEVARIVSAPPSALWEKLGAKSGITRQAFVTYFDGKAIAHAIVIKRAWKLQTPIHLSILRDQNVGFHPPQNFRYVREDHLHGLTGLRKPSF
jgi:predicted transcriptional regulator